MKGFLTNEANIIGLESRTSSPLSIPRDNQTLQHIKIKNLFPCGEGAGYAGGIVSAAIDVLRYRSVCPAPDFLHLGDDLGWLLHSFRGFHRMVARCRCLSAREGARASVWHNAFIVV